MMIIGCDFQTRYQQIEMVNDATGESTQRRVDHRVAKRRERAEFDIRASSRMPLRYSIDAAVSAPSDLPPISAGLIIRHLHD
jgi:hypothetical protein